MAGLNRFERASREEGGYRWAALSVTTFCQAATVSLSQAIGPLAPIVQEDFQLSRSEVGLIMTFTSLSIAVVAVAGGRLADHVGVRRVLMVSGLVTTLAALLIWRVESYPLFLAVCLLLGLGTGIQNPAGSAAVMRWFPPRQRGLAMGIRQTGVPVGGILGAILWPLVALAHGWRVAYLLGGVATLLGAALIFAAYFDPPSRVGTSRRKPTSLRKLLAERQIWFLGLIFNAQIVAQFSAGAYFVLFIHETLDVSVVQAAALLALVNGVAIAARIGWGVLSDVLFRGRRKPVLVVVLVLTLCATLGAAALPPGAPLLLAIGLAVLLGVSAFAWAGVLGTLVIETAGRESAATAIALVSVIGSPGSLLAPPLFGFIVDQTGSYQVAWLAACLVVSTGLLAVSRVAERPARRA